MPVLDGAAHDRHLQTHAASGRQSGVSVQGEGSPEECLPPVVQRRLTCGLDSTSNSLTPLLKTADLWGCIRGLYGSEIMGLFK